MVLVYPTHTVECVPEGTLVRVSLFSNRQTRTPSYVVYTICAKLGFSNKCKVKAVKVHTDKNLADMFTKCLAATVRRRLFDEIEAIAIQITKVKS